MLYLLKTFFPGMMGNSIKIIIPFFMERNKRQRKGRMDAKMKKI